MLGGLVALLVVAAIIAAQITIPYYVITPGDASPVGQYIEVPQADNHPISGNILLTDVFVSQLNALGYLQYRYLDSNNEIYSSQDLLGPSTSSSEFVDQGYLEMTQAQSFATAAALSHLGYTVTSSNAGALDLRDRAGFPGGQGAEGGAGDHGGQRHADHVRSAG